MNLSLFTSGVLGQSSGMLNRLLEGVVGRRTTLPQWRSRMTFVLALAASAVGVGNLWRFSYLVGEHGGAAFILLYLLCLFVLGVPVMVAEVALGSYTRASPVIALRDAADRSLRSRLWVWVALPAGLAALSLLAYYAIVAGWALDLARALQQGRFASASLLNAADYFQALVLDLPRQVYWQSLFLLLTGAVVVAGVRRGLGLLVWVLVPLLIALLGVLVQFAFANGALPATREFLFSVQWLDFSWASLRAAMGHAFFTLGVGAAVGVCYGAYAEQRVPIGRSVMAVAVFDTLVSIAAGLAIFPLVLAQNLVPTEGPGLLFIAVPEAFGNTSGGELFGALFFLLLVVAALGGAIALLETVVSSLAQALGLRRLTAVACALAVSWVLALWAVESLGTSAPGQHSFFLRLDQVVTGLLLPLAALGLSLFVGWRMRRELLRARLYRESDALFDFWYALLRYLVPPAILGLMAMGLWQP